MKCLVLGGGGFIGLNLCEALLAAKHQVRVFERPRLTLDGTGAVSADAAVTNLEWYEGDFANRSDIEAAVAGCDIVFHLICTTLPSSSNDNPVYDIETNLVATIGLLEAARAAKVRKIVFVSSGGTIYGIPTALPIPEDHPTAPICSYGITKLAIERYLHLYHHLHGLDYCVLRVANPYGEHQRPTSMQGAVGVFLGRALRNEAIAVWGDGSVVRDYVYIGDLVSALVKSIDYSGSDRIFNIGSGRGHSLNELIAVLESVLGHDIERIEKRARVVDVQANVLDISKARRALQWEPQTTLHDGVRRMLRWMRSVDGAHAGPRS